MVWTENVSTEDKEALCDLMRNIESDLVTKDAAGEFADIFFYKEYAIKYTSFWDYEEILYGKDYFDMQLQCDSWIFRNVQSPYLPKFYGASTVDSFVIMEKMQGLNLEDYLQNGGELTQDIEKQCKEFLLAVVNAGWMPLDFRYRSVFPFEKDGLKVIDFNLYQEISHLELTDFEELDITLPPAEWVDMFWERLKKSEAEFQLT